jgi:hypothetical protein
VHCELCKCESPLADRPAKEATEIQDQLYRNFFSSKLLCHGKINVTHSFGDSLCGGWGKE